MKTSSYTRSKKNWTSEQEALLDVLKQNPPLTEEQLIAGHDEKQFRWILKQETNSSSSDTSGCLLIVAVIICAVLGFSFYESERRKESFENRTVNELKAVEPSDFYNQGKEEQSEPISDPEQNNDTIENNGNEFDNILKEAAQEALSDAIIETVSGQSNSQKNIYDCDWCGDEIKGKVYYVNYHGSQYGKDWYVSSNYGQGDYHQSCAYEVCKNKRD